MQSPNTWLAMANGDDCVDRLKSKPPKGNRCLRPMDRWVRWMSRHLKTLLIGEPGSREGKTGMKVNFELLGSSLDAQKHQNNCHDRNKYHPQARRALLLFCLCLLVNVALGKKPNNNNKPVLINRWHHRHQRFHHHCHCRYLQCYYQDRHIILISRSRRRKSMKKKGMWWQKRRHSRVNIRWSTRCPSSS